jgi:hypothetical protein
MGEIRATTPIPQNYVSFPLGFPGFTGAQLARPDTRSQKNAAIVSANPTASMKNSARIAPPYPLIPQSMARLAMRPAMRPPNMAPLTTKPACRGNTPKRDIALTRAAARKKPPYWALISFRPSSPPIVKPRGWANCLGNLRLVRLVQARHTARHPLPNCRVPGRYRRCPRASSRICGHRP